VAAGEYFSRIVSYFTKGSFTDEYGVTHGGGHHFNFTLWEVLNEPNYYAHYQQPPSPIATYTKIYDGVTSVLHRDHPQLTFAAMCWGGTQVSDFQYFFDRSNHNSTAPWPPAFVTFHIYSSPSDMFGESLVGPLVNAAEIVSLVRAQSPTTRVFMDELGIFGCPDVNYTDTLDAGSQRVAFWNSRAAWFAVMCVPTH
jgi:hypothetical protein